ncbi:aspartate--tRNA ligase [Thermomicrobium sp. 4228-Ro]|nr:aspartate--tRNA ligase [Thermomicrobium sp. 4228-Ro]MCX2726065.1 aspartate--tRNA ligase [Thermomicrobium sp. 4228-Ro]
MSDTTISARAGLRRHTTCGELRREHVGRTVTLKGWVHRRRDHGGLIFLDLRDRYGITQVVANPAHSPDAHATAERVRAEYVLAVTGQVVARPEGTVNPALPTGEIEVVADRIEILNPSKTPPFPIAEETDVDESLRLEYRYLDLRRARLQRNLLLRHRVVRFVRQYLEERDFVEIETPMLIKSTPEGARDYVVPSRIFPGHFYALPQSPQQLKQLLMVAGFDRYYQIARCMRDEDLRADRQPEFTQIDLEMSFVDVEDVIDLVEGLYTEMFEQFASKPLKEKPFPRLTYAEAMLRYGSDKPDLRFGLEIQDVSDVFTATEFGVFKNALAAGGVIRGFAVPGFADATRSQLDQLTELARSFGAKGLVWLALQQDEGRLTARSPVAKFLSEHELATLAERFRANPGDLLLLVADAESVAANVLGRLRNQVARDRKLIDESVHAFCWVIDPPLFEWNEDEQRWEAMHHPFTSPRDEDIPLLDSDPSRVRAKAYDLVADGYELGTGSIRIHQREVQNKIFSIMGYDDAEIERRFGHLLRAFEYGAPPHGGMAPGLDRTVMILAGESSLREVIAFPKNQRAQDLMLGAPSPIDERQLRELHLCIVDTEESSTTGA